MNNRERGKQSLRVWLRLLSCENQIEQYLRTRLRKEFDVTLPQFDVLSELDHAGQQLTMSHLSEKLMVSNGNVTGVVDRLERNGYVTRQASPTDRRVQHILLTDAGRNKFQEMATIHEQWVKELFNDLDADKLEKLLELLNTTRASVTRNAKLEQ